MTFKEILERLQMDINWNEPGYTISIESVAKSLEKTLQLLAEKENE